LEHLLDTKGPGETGRSSKRSTTAPKNASLLKPHAHLTQTVPEPHNLALESLDLTACPTHVLAQLPRAGSNREGNFFVLCWH
jgi:hypothetical protein